jgi:RNA-directed DNA polymerase
LPPDTGDSLPQLVKDLAPYLLGWRGYFGFCQTPRVLTNLEAWIRRRLRSYLWRQWQNGPNRFKELRRRGVTTVIQYYYELSIFGCGIG